MLDRHIYRRILWILEDMRQNMAGETKKRDIRPMEEYLSGLQGVREALSALSLPRQKIYGAILSRLFAAMERMSRKHALGRKQRLFCGKMLEELSVELRGEREVKKDIVFLPVKAAMWDSMESIWKAATDDKEHCNVYVIPLPYYGKKPDNSPREWYCEKDCFPKEVPVLDWQEVDLAAMHPDIIYINFPYDNANLVTSVDARFYSSNLREMTDLLVYVDYGINIWVPLDSSRANVSGWYTVPGDWYADVIPVYSVECAGVLSRAMEITWQKVGDWAKEELQKDKIVALGSAKFDKVLAMRREDTDLPEEWRRRIEGRNVLLYNLSLYVEGITAEEYLGDIRSVIETVSRRDDIVLWWRPHPLLETALYRKAPEIVDDYLEIVEDFRSNRRGIYDDTPDVHRAVVWSDGCLTGESSLSWLYVATGKPFTIWKHSRLRPGFQTDYGKTFREPLLYRIANMRAGKGANIHRENLRWNFCVWWDNFVQEDLLHNIRYDHFLERFLHFIVHPEEYPEADAYRELQMQIFKDFVANPDGTAGKKIYEYCKGRRRSGIEGSDTCRGTRNQDQ